MRNCSNKYFGVVRLAGKISAEFPQIFLIGTQFEKSVEFLEV
jgi:hypothetical protein